MNLFLSFVHFPLVMYLNVYPDLMVSSSSSFCNSLDIDTFTLTLNRNVNSDGFKPHTQSHLAPVLATAVKVVLSQTYLK